MLAPDHVWLTTQSQPTLYWYERTPAAARFRFALNNDAEIEPLLEQTGLQVIATLVGGGNGQQKKGAGFEGYALCLYGYLRINTLSGFS